MEQVPSDGYRFFLLVGEFDFCGIEVRVEFATDGQSCGRCGVGDEVDDSLVSFEWSPAPVLSNFGEESVVKAPLCGRIVSSLRGWPRR